MEETEQALVQAVLGDDGEAVRRLVQRYRTCLLTAIERVLSARGRRGGGEEVLQTVLLEVFRNDYRLLRSWNPTLGRSLRTYLSILAERRTRDALRKDQRERPVEDETLQDLVDAPHEALARQDRTQRLRMALQSFQQRCHEDEWRFFEQCFIEDRPMDELSHAWGITSAAAYQRRHRLRERLLAELDDDEATARRRPHRGGRQDHDG